MITLAFAQMVDFIARQADQYTGGENGLPGIPRPALGPIHFENPLNLYYFTLALAALGYLVAARAIESPLDQALRSIRDNRVRAQSVGYNPRVQMLDRKSTRLNSSHDQISYAVFCLKKKKKKAHLHPYQKKKQQRHNYSTIGDNT